MDDHHTICVALEDLELSHIARLGGALGLLYSKCADMSSIEELVASWLRGEDNVLNKKYGKPTWNRLASALEEIRQMGYMRLVDVESFFLES